MDLFTVHAFVAARLERHGDVFRSAQLREDALTGYSSLRGALAADSTEEARYALVGALVREYQRTRHPLWADALFVALHPMLATLRGRVRCRRAERDEIDGLIVASFYAACARVKATGGAVILAVRRRTERGTFAHLRNARASEVAERSARTAFEEAVTPNLADAVDVGRLVRCRTEVGRGESLRVRVEAANCNASDAERARVYERLKKQRTRARAQLRVELAAAA